MLKALFKRLDPRIVSELKLQRRSILLGLMCVAVTSLLQAGTIPLIKLSIQAIADAGQIVEQKIVDKGDIKQLSNSLGKSENDVTKALQEVQKIRGGQTKSLSQAEEDAMAQTLKVEPSKIHAAFQSLNGQTLTPRRSPKEAVQSLGWICLLVVAIYAMRYWFTRGQVYYLSYAATNLTNNLRRKLYAKLQKLPISYFNEKRAGAIFSVLTNDVNVYQSAVSIIRDSIDAPLKAVSAFALVLWLQWQLGLVTAVFLPIMAFAIQRNARKMKAAQAKVQNDLANLAAVTQESINGMRVIKAFSAEDRMLDKYGEHVNQSFRSQMGAVRRLASLRPLVELIGAFALATVFYLCGWLAFHGNLQVADIAAIAIALDMVNQGARSMGSVNNTYAQVRAATDRIYSEVLDVPEQHGEQEGAKVLQSPKGQIEFKNVSFSYPDGTLALKNVSFVLEPGTSLALVGPSGAGKSTIADLVLRFYDPTEGQILFDGVDLREIKGSWLRSQIGVVPQQTFLFAGSISENIRLGEPDADEDRVKRAAIAAHATPFIERMPERYETVLGERGTRISGGEAQRVAIARALVKEPSVLLLDEATSALDAVSEKAVQQALDEIMKERTTLFIAHRLTTAARADRIMVLRAGEVVEIGSHKDLMAQDGAYATMYRAFSSGLLDEIG